MRLPDAPRVVVLLVATDGARWLPEVLDGLRDQAHRPLDVLAVDNASSDGSGDLLVGTLGGSRVVRLERRVGYGRALAAGLAVASEWDLDADAYLLLHDDAALAPGAIEEMLRILADSDVGIVGCKLVEWDDVSVLQDIGITTDRYGRTVPRIEKGEIDQGQHDAVRPILAVQSAAMLVAKEVIQRIGLFDLRYEMLRDDLDLCWRARIAGYRTAITTHTHARHAAAATRGLRMSAARRAQRFLADRNMIASLVKNYGGLRLAFALPITIAISLVNVVLFFATGRRQASFQVLRALWWNLRHLPSTLASRRKAQRLRRASDAEVTALMHHGATRLRQQVSHGLDALVGGAAPGDLDAAPPRLIDRVRAHPAIATAVVVAMVGLIALRPLLFEGPIAGMDMPTFPGSGRDLFRAFLSGWRGPGEGGAGPATPGLALLGALTTFCFGSVWLAARLLVVGLPIAGAVAAGRLAMSVGIGRGASRVAGVLYGLSPLMLGALSAGRLHDLAVMAGMPLVILLFARAAGLAPSRAPFAAIAGIVAAASLGPWLLAAVIPLAALVALITRTRLPLAAGVRASIIGGALLFPWTFEMIRPSSPVMAGGPDPIRTMWDLLALAPGSFMPIPRALSYGLVLAAFVGFVTTSRLRRPTAQLFGGLAIVGLMAAWAIERQVPLAPRAALPLALTALSMAVLASLALESIPPRLAERTFGMTHVVAGVAGLALILQLGAGMVWVGAGERRGITQGRELLPATFASERERIGDYRVLWVLGDRSNPRYSLTGSSGDSMTSYLSRQSGSGAEALQETVTAIAGGGTTSGGRLLATFGVAFVVLRPGTADDLAEEFSGQVDLGFFQQTHGAVVLSNDAALPIASGVRAKGWVLASEGPLDGVAGAESSPGAGEGFRARGLTRYAGKVASTRVVVLAEDYSSRWRLYANGRAVTPQPSFGWANRFVLPEVTTGEITIRWSGNGLHRLMLLVELILLLLFVGAWYQSREKARS